MFSGDNMKYKDLLFPIEQLINNETRVLALLGNVSAFLFEYIENLNWVGFYLNDNNTLYLGPFQGKVACSIIEYGNGVCGTALKTTETIVVPNVHEYDNHIACDSASNSEVVIPIIVNNNVYGVLDVDSPLLNRFDDALVQFLKKVVNLVETKLATIL